MAIGISNNCPICWDSYEICECTMEDRNKYDADLALKHKQQCDQERKEYHDLLDASFDNMPVFEGPFPPYFAKQILKRLNRGQWNRLKKQFDVFFEAKNLGVI